MSNDPEKYFEVFLPEGHALSARVPEAYDPINEEAIRTPEQGVFRTEIAIMLKQTFERDVFPLRETRFQNQLSYRFAVKAEKADDFRHKISELGLTLKESGNSKR